MKIKAISFVISTALLTAGLVFSAQANAKGRLVMYCSATNEMCEAEANAFGEKHDVKVSFIRNGSGSTFAKIDAEKIIRNRMFGMVEPWIRNHKPGIRLIGSLSFTECGSIGRTFPRSGKSKRQLKFSNLYGNFRLRR